MTDKFFNKKYLKDTIYLLKVSIDDLGAWSCYNDDKLSDELEELDKVIKKLEDK